MRSVFDAGRLRLIRDLESPGPPDEAMHGPAAEIRRALRSHARHRQLHRLTLEFVDATLTDMEPTEPLGTVAPFDELPHGRHFHEWVGAEYGDVPFSIILVHCAVGIGPKLHRHPYAEVLVVEEGEATFQLGDRQLVVPAGNVVVGPPNIPHRFTNSGAGELRLVSIHGADRFDTVWSSGPDPEWVTPPAFRR